LHLDRADIAISKAIHAASDRVRAAPDSVDAWAKLAMVLAAHDINETAADCFSRAAELAPDDPRWPYLQGTSLTTSRPEVAVTLLERSVQLTRKEIPANPRLRLAELLLELGRVDEAQSHILTTLQVHPTNDRAHLLWSRSEFMEGNWQACLDSLAKIQRPVKKAVVLEAEARQRLGQHAEADRLRKVADGTRDIAWPDPYLDRISRFRTGLKAKLVKADKLYGVGRYADSIAILEQVIGDYPDSDWAKVLLGRALIKVKRYEDSEQQLRAALEIAPQSVEGQFRLGVSLFRQNRFDEAIEQFRKSTRLKPDLTMAYYNLSFCLDEIGDLAGAVKSMRQCVQTEPGYSAGWHRLALLEEKQDNIERARAAFQRALTLDPDNRLIKEQLRLLDVDTTVDLSDLEP
jgi:tetratricopeptide (TPR) repeat protein